VPAPHLGHARGIPKVYWKEVQYAGHIGIPSGLVLPCAFGIEVLRTGVIR